MLVVATLLKGGLGGLGKPTSVARFSTIIVRPGCAFNEIASQLRPILRGPRALIITDDHEQQEGRSREGRLAFELRKVGIDCHTAHIPSGSGTPSWPEPKAIEEAIKLARRVGAGALVALGGGRAVDGAKAAAAGLAAPAAAAAAGGKPRGPFPVLAVPATCGLGGAAAAVGSEAWTFDEDKEVLVPLPSVHPAQVVLADPELLSGLGAPQLTWMALAAVGGCADGLVHWALQGPTIGEENPYYKLSILGIELAAAGLHILSIEPDSPVARQKLMEASICAGQVSIGKAGATFKLFGMAWLPAFAPLQHSALSALILPRWLATLAVGLEEEGPPGGGDGGGGAAAARARARHAFAAAAARICKEDGGVTGEFLHRWAWDTLHLTGLGDLSDLSSQLGAADAEGRLSEAVLSAGPGAAAGAGSVGGAKGWREGATAGAVLLGDRYDDYVKDVLEGVSTTSSFGQ